MIEVIDLGAGCFWGIEFLFSKLPGVKTVRSGYSGGKVLNPSYQDICTGTSGHAEVVKIEFESSVITLREILCYFFKMHDPTTLNVQGYDRGTQYRSVIYYYGDDQRDIALKLIDDINPVHFNNEITTEVTKADVFYPAEEYHQDYYTKRYNGNDGPICHFIRDIKLE
jgi:peptide-methionine (S)-S-oxide reductase